MIRRVNESINNYFNNLKNVGYRKQSDVNKLFLYTTIQELLDNDFRGYITEDDYKSINNALYCLYGSNCLIPFPEYHNYKIKRTMYKGSMSEIAHRLEAIENINNNITSKIEEVITKPIVVPGDNIKEVEDFSID